MRYLKTIFGVVLFLYERFRGPKTIIELKHASDALGSMGVHTVRGHKLTIFCQRRRYRIVYDKWYIPNRIKTGYRVFSVVTHDAPIALRKACELDVNLPELISNWNFSNEIRRSQVLAYLDLLEKRMVIYE